MNVFLQIGLGLLPGAAVAIILLLKRRAFNIGKIILAGVIALASIILIIAGLAAGSESRREEARLSQRQLMLSANAFVREGAYDEAREVIDQYSEAYGYDDECRLLVSRIAVLEGDYEKAAYLYEYLYTNTDLISIDDQEVQYATRKANGSSSDLALVSYLQSVGENITDYGYTEASINEMKTNTYVDPETVRGAVLNSLEEDYLIPDDMLRYAHTIAQISNSYEDINGEGNPYYYDYTEVFNEIEENAPEFMNLECVNKARIKAYVLAGDFSAITGAIDDDSTYHELMIAAELYMSGMTGEYDFNDSYNELNRTDVFLIRKAIEKIYQKLDINLTVQEEKALTARVEAVLRQLDDPVLTRIKEQLTRAAADEAGPDRTKVYLELAKIEYYFGNNTATDKDLSEAIYSSQDNEDDSYVAAMSQIISVINNDDSSNSENIKNVSEYVDKVLDHSLTVDVEEIVSPGNENFEQNTVDYVSRAKSAISIGRIDTSNWEEISARVIIDSDYLTETNDLKAALKVYDCGAEIKDFTLEKIEYDESNIILLCDVSGSMDGSIQDLRDAVVTFITDRNPDENLAVVTFNSYIVDTKFFGTPDDELIAFAQSMNANGGTDMFSAAINCLGRFTKNSKSNNILILMTDGKDNYPKSEEEIEREIGQLALQQGVLVYTLGLGSDVDTYYLETIADSGNGGFVYVSDSASLTSFYDMLHAQLHSQYEIKYKAKDTMTMTDRTLEVVIPSENSRDLKRYSLDGAEDSENDLAVYPGTCIYGLSPRYIYKGLQNVEVRLKGSGFIPEAELTVKLDGNIDYMIEATYTDNQTYTLNIPSSVAVGTYNVELTINGRRKILPNGFAVIAPGSEKKTSFGPYLFTSMEKIVNGKNDYTLKGFVTLNDWLHFNGDIRIVGDLENGGSIKVTDESGSFVEYDMASAEGLALYYAENDINCTLPALYTFTLYNDAAHMNDYDEYLVEDIQVGALDFFDFIKFDSVSFRLYPDSIGFHVGVGSTVFPYQKQILKKHNGNKDIFHFAFDAEARLTHKTIGFIVDLDFSSAQDTYNHQLNFLSSPVYFNGSIKAKINTLKNEYMLGFMVRFAFLSKQSGFGAEIEWKGSLVPYSVKVSLELAKAVMLPTFIPIEVNNFGVKVSEIDEAVKSGNFFNLKLNGYASFSSGKVKEYVPFLEKFIGNISVFEMPDTTIGLRACPFLIEAEATLYFLSEIKLAEAGVQIGTFDYKNDLLALDEEVTGFTAKAKTGIMWDTADGRIHVDISGALALVGHSRFIGITADGTMEYDIGWWIIHSEDRISGTAALGLYNAHSGRTELIFAYKTQDSHGKNSGAFYYIDFNGHCGKRNGALS